MSLPLLSQFGAYGTNNLAGVMMAYLVCQDSGERTRDTDYHPLIAGFITKERRAAQEKMV